MQLWTDKKKINIFEAILEVEAKTRDWSYTKVDDSVSEVADELAQKLDNWEIMEDQICELKSLIPLSKEK